MVHVKSVRKTSGRYVPRLVGWVGILLVVVSAHRMAFADSPGGPARIYTIDGKYVGEQFLSPPPSGTAPRALQSLTVQSANGAGTEIPAGIYLVSSVGDAPPAQRQGAQSGFFDITDQTIPLEEWDAGSIRMADLNADGLTDVVFTISSTQCDSIKNDRPRIWIQTIFGTFNDETELRMPDFVTSTREVEIFDADGDGHPDIFLGGYYCPKHHFPGTLLFNDGNGFFTMRPKFILPVLSDDEFVYFAAPGKIDGNSSIDLVVTIYKDSGFTAIDTLPRYILPQLWLNNGNGIFRADTLGRFPDPGKHGFLLGITVGPITADTVNDILFTAGFGPRRNPRTGLTADSLSGQLVLYKNQGLGFFTDESADRLPEGTLRTTRAASIADVNNDHSLDILELGFFLSYPPQVRMLLNDGSGHFTVNTDTVILGLDGWLNVAKFGNFNRDSFPDIFIPKVGIGEDAYDLLLMNDGAGKFLDSSALLPQNLDFTVDASLFDYEHDGDLDIMLLNSSPYSDLRGRNKLYRNGLSGTVDVTDPGLLPDRFRLFQNFPNPFNPTTDIAYSLARGADVEIQIVDLLGRVVMVSRQGRQSAGQYHLHWVPRQLSSGMYVCRLLIDGRVEATMKLAYLR